jgi:hypothetical protein
MYIDEGYDFPEGYELLEEEYGWLYNSHPIKRRRKKQHKKRKIT